MDWLHEVTQTWGNTTLIESDPGEETCHSAIYVPVSQHDFFDKDPQWGIYDRDGRLVEAAAYYRGPSKQLVGQCRMTTLARADLDFVDEDLIYGGPFIDHYGHFLTASLPRLWHLRSAGGSKRRILCHGHGDPEQWFAYEFVRVILSAIGLTPEDFVCLAAPSVIRRLWVPRPAMEEQNFVHRALDDLGVAIGRTYGCHREPRSDVPIYLSKTRLTKGVSRYEDEQILERCFAASGFDIVHPQDLCFADQIRLFARAPTITGTAGSGLHTSLFLDRPSRIVALAVANLINSNFRLIDRLKGSEALYLWPKTEAQGREADDGFQSVWTIEDITEVAREMAEVAGEFASRRQL
jgi:capsular polysaccharide biosynthesis protein